VFGWANEGLSSAKAAGHALMQFFSDLWDQTVSSYRKARDKIASTGKAAIQSASSTYHAAEAKVVRRYHQAERELYDQLTHRYADVKGAIEEYNSPEAKQRRQWAAEAAEYDRMRAK
jgi:hypothetical protein